MKITHVKEREIISKENCQDCSLLLSNRIGGYLWLSDYVQSRYQGVFFEEEGKLFRVVESIGIQGETDEIINRFWCVERRKGANIERMFMPYGFNCLIYENEGISFSQLFLDIKESYINDIPASYSTEENLSRGLFIIKAQFNNEEFYVVVKFKGNVKVNNVFLERRYNYDEKRNSPPFSRAVYNAAEFDSRQIVLSFSKQKGEAIRNAEFVFKNIKRLKKKQINSIKGILTKNFFGNQEIDMAYNCAKVSLYNLSVIEKGLYAGFPWFFHFWARDEIISLKALRSIKSLSKLRQKIFERWLLNVQENGRMPAKLLLNGEYLGVSADSLGWLFKRSEDMPLSKRSRIAMQKAAYKKPELIVNDLGETWMDTIGRKGKRLEMQALKLAVFNAMYQSTRKDEYRIKEDILRGKVRKEFFKGGLLLDAPEDSSIRPNIFIACYLYPKLLNKKEWGSCFSKALEKLWCEWDVGGGVSTLDKTSPLFIPFYSGEDSKSYHNGDAWFWINNLSATVLNKIDKRQFSHFIDKIVASSVEEILWKGAIGNHSEISSASCLSSCGCISQAWSTAMFIEMIEAIFMDKY